MTHYLPNPMDNQTLPTTLAGCHAELTALRIVHQQELERRQAVEDELERSQRLLQLVMDTLPEAIFWKDRESRYLGCNKNFAQDAGLKKTTDIIGQDDYDMPWSGEEADFYRSCDRQVMDANKPEFGIVEPQLNGDGEKTWLETNKAPLHDADGNVIGILGTYQDVTSRREAEIKLQELNQKLQRRTDELDSALEELQRSQLQLIQNEKMSALGNLVAGVAHEINNPVTFLSGNLIPAREYIDDLFEAIELYRGASPNLDAETEEAIAELDLDFIREDLPKMLGSMKEGIRRVSDISVSLRTFSRADTTSATEFSVNEGLDSTILILKHRIKANDMRPPIQIDKRYGELPEITCFPGKLNQVFMNLLSNAIDALDEANQGRSFQDILESPNRITVTTVLDQAQSQVRICIADNGPGISDDVQEKIFEQYFTTKNVGKGTGLGLAISQQIIVQDHGGKLDFDSQLNQGSTFTITLPLKRLSLQVSERFKIDRDRQPEKQKEIANS
ncbi:MAG: ATP-binding protein [Cyanobacteria bacterium P01_D01_bin.73]